MSEVEIPLCVYRSLLSLEKKGTALLLVMAQTKRNIVTIFLASQSNMFDMDEDPTFIGQDTEFPDGLYSIDDQKD